MNRTSHKTHRLVAPAVIVLVLAALTLGLQATVSEKAPIPTYWWSPAHGIEAKPLQRIKF